MLIRTLIACLTAVFLLGCASLKPQPDQHGILTNIASRPAETNTNKLLKNLPEPLGKITAAVYGFRDLTGQNKPAPASGFSTAVTQGAESILIKAMLDSNWFNTVERSGLQNVLTERNLWNQQLGTEQGGGRALTALPPANIIFEGGILSYDFNIRTGGAGAKYLGIGGSQQYREDVVTINLRVINAQTGTILHSVLSRKNIFSKSINTGLFGFVDFDKILELESGYAYNEPVQTSVVEAIESGLIDLIVEGIVAGTWSLSDPNEIRRPELARFLDDKALATYEQHISQQKQKSSSTLPIPTESSNNDLNETSETQKKTIATEASHMKELSNNGNERPKVAASTTLGDSVATRIKRAKAAVEKLSKERQKKPPTNNVRTQSTKKKTTKSLSRKAADSNSIALAAKPVAASQPKQEKPPNKPPNQVSAAASQKSESLDNQQVKSTTAGTVSEQKASSSTPVAKRREVFLLVGEYDEQNSALKLYNLLKENLADVDAQLGLAIDPKEKTHSVQIGPISRQSIIDAVIDELRRLKISQAKVVEAANSVR